MSEPWLSVDEVASHLGVSKGIVYSWITNRQIPAHKSGRLWKFQASVVDSWVCGGGAAANQRAGDQDTSGES